jgi:hypothetical protein
MKNMIFLIVLCKIAFTSCKVEQTQTEANLSAVKTLGWEGDERACRIFARADGSYLLFASSNSLGNGLFDPLVCALDKQFNISSRKTYGDHGSEILRGVLAMRDGRFIAWGTRQNPLGPDTDIYLLACDANGELLWERTIAPGPGTYDDIPVGAAEADNGACIIACRSASNQYSAPGLPHLQSAFVKIAANGDIVWTLQHEANSSSNVCTGILPAANHEFIVIIHELTIIPGGRTQVARLRDAATMSDTPELYNFKDLTTKGLHPEKAVLFYGTDDHCWYYSAYHSEPKTVLLRIADNGTELSATSVSSEGAAAVSHAAVWENRCWLLEENRENPISPVSRMGIYSVGADGINIQKPILYGGSFRNTPQDLIPLPGGRLLLLGTMQSPNNPGSDILLLTLQADGKP